MNRAINLGILIIIAMFLNGCNQGANQKNVATSETLNAQAGIAFNNILKKHLNAVSQRDFEALKSTLPDSGAMHLILPNGKMFTKVSEFLALHEEWFKDKSWTMDTKILYTDHSNDYGIALVEAMNREPERNGKPYFHKMLISYTLKKQNGKWMVIADHASTIEKSE